MVRLDALDHELGGVNFRRSMRRRGFHIENDAMGDID